MRAHTQTYVTDFAVPVDERTEDPAVQGFGSSGAVPQSLIEPSAVGYMPTGKPDGLPPLRDCCTVSRNSYFARSISKKFLRLRGLSVV